MKWSTACPDWRERILEGRSLVPCKALFPAEAEAALDVFKSLKVVDLPMVPGPEGPRFQTFGEVCRPWVFEFVEAIFGAYDADSGKRLINEFLLLISKKNGKSTIAAGIMITALVLNWRHSAELSILAPTIKVAQNSADPAMAMVQRDPLLFEILKPIPHLRAIEHRTMGAVLRILAADDEVAAGSKAGFVLIDEEWLFGKSVKAENMLLEATGGLISRPEGFVIKLSTQSDEPPAGIWRDDLRRFRDIRDGNIEEPRSMGVLYEFPEDMIEDGSYKKPENWHITNPNLDASVSREILIDKFKKAEIGGPKSLAAFFAKHVNVEIGQSQRSDRWGGAEFWEKQAKKPRYVDPALKSAQKTLLLDDLLAQSETVTIGIDGGGLDDLLGLAVLGRHKESRDWLLWSHAWAHEIVLERRKEIASSIRDFEKDGDLTIVKNIGDDVEHVADVVEQVAASGLLPVKMGIGVDQAGISAIADALEQRGLGGDRIGGVPQGWKLNNAIKTTERRLAGGTLWHSGSPLMAWAVGNARVEARGNAITITKQISGSAKIDPLMALFDAVVAMDQNPESARSVYEERPLLVL